MPDLHALHLNLHCFPSLYPNQVRELISEPLQHCNIIHHFAMSREKLEEKLARLSYEPCIIFSGITADANFPENRDPNSKNKVGRAWLPTSSDDTFHVMRKIFKELFEKQFARAYYFITDVPRARFLSDELEIYLEDKGIYFLNPFESDDREAIEKATAEFIVKGIKREDALEKIYAMETQTAFLDKHVFCGLEILETTGVGPDKRSFSISDFRLILERVKMLRIDVMGMHCKPLHGGSYGMQLWDWNTNDFKGSDWYHAAFEKMAEEYIDHAYFAEFFIPQKLIVEEFGIKTY